MKLSIVTTLYKSAPYIREFYERSTAVAKQVANDDYEIVFVNDGSPDESVTLAIELTENDSHIVVVDLSRNFGHHKAIMSGLNQSVGDYVFVVDVDLEEPPELLTVFWKKLFDCDVDCVYGVQEQRKGGWFERVSGYFYYKAFNILSDIQLTPNALVAKLMTRRFVMALTSHVEHTVFLGGIMEITGFKQLAVLAKKTSKGSTTYSLSIKLKQLVNSITAFSSKPLYYVFYMGLISSIAALGISLLLLIQKILSDSIPDGWTSLMIVILWVFSILMVSLGVVGIYISKIFDEVKNRPYVIVKKIFGKK